MKNKILIHYLTGLYALSLAFLYSSVEIEAIFLEKINLRNFDSFEIL